MMRVLNFGSLNIDHVYRVPHISQPGETVSSSSYQVFAGGKGANQSVALARAGARVFHAGQVGADGKWLISKLDSFGVDTRFICLSEVPTGHAIIQVDDSGQNSIVLFSGANKEIARTLIDTTLTHFDAGDLLLMQNEISELPYLMNAGHARGMKLYFNPAPFDEEVLVYPLHVVDVLFVNETEAMGLVGTGSAEDAICKIRSLIPTCDIVLTRGAMGVDFSSPSRSFHVPAVHVTPIDTTAAGDTFIGYFIACQMAGLHVHESLAIACHAAGLCVTRAGAMDSIPEMQEVNAFLRNTCKSPGEIQ